MDSRSKLFFSLHQPYDLEGTEMLFLDAVRKSIEYHQKNCRDYARILQKCGFHCSRLNQISDIAEIPVIPTLYLKKHPASSVPSHKLVTYATSSGTRGLKSKIGIDRKTLLYGLMMAERIFRYHGLISCIPTNYAVLGYKPKQEIIPCRQKAAGRQGMSRVGSPDTTGAARTLYGATMFAPGIHRAYAVKKNGERYEPDFAAFFKALCFYEQAGLPVRVMGFPSYLSYLCDFLKERKKKFRFAPGSKIILGGGWKTNEKDRISRYELFEKAETCLGIPKQQCYEFFSAVEHPVAYCSCKNHHFHVPIYSRVFVRDFASLKPLPYGEPGLLSFVTPLLGSAPCVSVMTDDIGILYEGASCGCGICSPYFIILGRAGETGITTCAMEASRHLSGGKE